MLTNFEDCFNLLEKGCVCTELLYQTYDGLFIEIFGGRKWGQTTTNSNNNRIIPQKIKKTELTSINKISKRFSDHIVLMKSFILTFYHNIFSIKIVNVY